MVLKIYNVFPYKGVCEYSFKRGDRKRTHYNDDWRRYDDMGWFHQKMYWFSLKHIFFSILLQPLTPKIEFNWYIIGSVGIELILDSSYDTIITWALRCKYALIHTQINSQKCIFYRWEFTFWVWTSMVVFNGIQWILFLWHKQLNCDWTISSKLNLIKMNLCINNKMY